MKTSDLLIDTFGRVREIVEYVVDGISPEDLHARIGPDANSIAWLVWHLTRIEDDHIAGLRGSEQLWTAQGWIERFDLPFDASATGYGFTSKEVAACRVDPPDLLVAYHDAVHAETVAYLETVDEAELDRIVDTSWDPPVSAGVRIVSVVADTLQHAGQAAYVRGVLESR
jgi:hypothetical protein